MKLVKLTLRAVGAFAGEVVVPFGDLPGGLVCLVGENGAGKTTLLEASGPGVLFREFPTRFPSGVLDLACSRDSELSLEFEHGGQQVRLLIRADRGTERGSGRKAECYVYVNGELVRETGTGKVDPFDAWIRDHLVDRGRFFANLFAVQKPGALKGVGQFQHLTKAQRSDLFAQMLGIGRFQTMAETAGAAVRTLEPEYHRVAGALTTCAGDQELIQQTKLELNEVRAALESAQTDLDAAEADLERARSVHEVKTGDLSAVRAVAGELARKRTLAANKCGALSRLDVELDELRGELAQEQEYREQVEQVAALETQRDKLREKHAGVKEQHYQAATAVASAVGAMEQTQLALTTAQEKVKGAQAAQVELETLGEDVPMADLEKAVDEALSAVVEAKAAEIAVVQLKRDRLELVTKLEHQERDQADRAGRAALLDRVPCEGAGEFAACELLKGAQEDRVALEQLNQEIAATKEQLAAPELVDLDDKVTAATAAVEQAKKLEQAKGKELSERRGRVQYVKHLELVAGQLVDWQKRERDHQAGLADLETAQATAAQDVERLVVELHQVELDGKGVAAGIEPLAQAREQLNHLVAMKEQLPGKEERKAELAAEVATLKTELAAGGDERLSELEAALSAAVRDQDAAAATEQTKRSNRDAQAHSQTRLEERLAQAQEPDERKQRLEVAQVKLTQHLAAWSVLSQALGRNGIQILEIDAAGPRVSELANRLLRETVGDRWTVEIVTVVPKKNPRPGDDPFRDVFDLQVVDGSTGRRQSLENLSGGEEAVVGEALREALAIVGNDRLAHPFRTQWLDESSAALSEAAARAFVARKRKAMEIGGLHQVLMVTHQREIWEQADALLVVQDGTVQAMTVHEYLALSS